MGVPADLRTHKQAIAKRWEREVLRDVPALSSLTRSALVDHMPEFLEGLAAWIEGDVESAHAAFRALAEGHALQRHSSGIDLATLTGEYVTLRRVILEKLIEISGPEELAKSLVSLEGGIDYAVHEAVRRYSEARDHVRERFIGILGHDLRDPLTAVMMSATLLQDMPLGDKQAQLVERVTRGARRIERMIDDVLDFARGRLSGGIPITPTLVDMTEICAAAIDEARALGPARDMKLEHHGDLRGFFDRDRVRQALANLLANARIYGTGDVILRAWERDDHHAVFTSVHNTGPVIPPDMLKQIFEPFTRTGTQARGQGLGLGLYIVEQIAIAHGGVCRATSSEEEGTTFTIEWPRVPMSETPDRPTK
ncbi:MAG TPA: sensor histidine kinase [Kofleriaceae bacterium]|nr:sensor histidine kinase [Kofleriaceae bacterium]